MFGGKRILVFAVAGFVFMTIVGAALLASSVVTANLGLP